MRKWKASERRARDCGLMLGQTSLHVTTDWRSFFLGQYNHRTMTKKSVLTFYKSRCIRPLQYMEVSLPCAIPPVYVPLAPFQHAP